MNGVLGIKGLGLSRWILWLALVTGGGGYADSRNVPSGTEAIQETVPSRLVARSIWVTATKLSVGARSTVLIDESERKALIAFCQNPPGCVNQPISRIYFAAGWHGFGQLSENDGALRSLIREAHDAGISFFIAEGWHRWVEPKHRASATRIIRRDLAFNRAGDPDEQFDGILLDIEPHVAKADENGMTWATIWTNYLAVLDDVVGEVSAYNAAAEQPITIGEAIPDWYAAKRSGELGSYVDVIDRVDFIWLMSYHDSVDTIRHRIRDEVSYAQTVNKPAVLGVFVDESYDSHGIGAKNTFWEEGRGAVDTAVDELNRSFQSTGGLREFSFYTYEYWRRMAP